VAFQTPTQADEEEDEEDDDEDDDGEEEVEVKKVGDFAFASSILSPPF
jgi:hypothetical protein